MDVDSAIPTDEAEVDTADKQRTDEVFKKPVFIGQRKGIKTQSKKITNTSNVSVSTEDVRTEEPKVVESKPDDTPKQPPLSYMEPNWKGFCNEDYYLEELKSGVIQRTISLKKKSLIVFGRIENCDIAMAHPTVSRYHAVLQYRGVPDGELDKGFYLYDVDSTHGTFLNKAKLKSKVYVRIKVGHMIKFGCSSRFFLLQGPEHDQEEESELTLTQLKEKRNLELNERIRKEQEGIALKEAEEEREKQLIEERGVTWGIGEDADEEEDLSENPYAVTTNEELYCDDPKKALKNWFEREGEELNFLTEQAEKGMIACKIVLPLDDGAGKEIIIETSARSKKEAQMQCALEACRAIDKLGLFRQSKQESKKHQKRNWEENDYYDSDEDSFFDRTGDLDAKRQKRMKKAGKIQETVETYESLMTKHNSVIETLNKAQQKLDNLLDRDQVKIESENDEQDALDSFMNSLKQNAARPSKLDIKIAKDEVAKLRKEEEHLRKLINIVKPTVLPELKPFTGLPASSSKVIEKGQSEVKPDVVKPEPIKEGSNSENKKPSHTKKTKVIGPTIPKDNQAYSNQNIKNKSTSQSNKKSETVTSEVPLDPEEDCVNLVWEPPKGQTGDGRTSLNDKFGY